MPRGPTKPYLCYPLRVVITVDSCLLSLIIGGLTTVCEVECGSRANNDRVLAKVVGRVVARWGVSTPRRVHSGAVRSIRCYCVYLLSNPSGPHNCGIRGLCWPFTRADPPTAVRSVPCGHRPAVSQRGGCRFGGDELA